MSGEDPTLATLRKLRRSGKLGGSEIDGETARALLKTPPSAASALNVRLAPLGATPGERRRSLAAAARAGEDDLPLPELVRTMEGLCEAFQTTISDNARLSKEFMGRSLLQLFEDSVRERLPDALQKTGRGGGAFGARPSAVVKQLSASRRPIDRGLDRKDHGSDVVIPDGLREAIANDINTIVEHELKRALTTVATDVQRLTQLAYQVKERVSAVEETMMQRQVDANIMGDQVQQQSGQIEALTSELATVRQQCLDKDQQMDVLREQLSRRNEALDDTRVKFRKEVMRYKTRIYELQSELETAQGRKRVGGGGVSAQGGTSGGQSVVGQGAAAGGGGTAGGSSGAADRRQSVMPSATSDQLDDDSQQEVFAAVETAVREATHKLQEDMRQLELQHIREKKLLFQEMNMKTAERDQEILKWKEKVRQIQAQLDDTLQSGDDRE